jgi:hypothetical protein
VRRFGINRTGYLLLTPDTVAVDFRLRFADELLLPPRSIFIVFCLLLLLAATFFSLVDGTQLNGCCWNWLPHWLPQQSQQEQHGCWRRFLFFTTPRTDEERIGGGMVFFDFTVVVIEASRLLLVVEAAAAAREGVEARGWSFLGVEA